MGRFQRWAQKSRRDDEMRGFRMHGLVGTPKAAAMRLREWNRVSRKLQRTPPAGESLSDESLLYCF